ncbi:SAV_915 family protein [Kitasatospora sp. NPDC002227]|uniref:SAV_915 family protein n=1 Tax=Kitasatospora sp. NPDC002227 TaxID=3154773 RepID=UPI00331870E6
MTDLGEHPARYVPVRTVGGAQVLRLFRERDGARCAVEFSSVAALRALLGPDQEVAELTERALRELTVPLGVEHIVLDPKLVAAATKGRRPAMAAAE